MRTSLYKALIPLTLISAPLLADFDTHDYSSLQNTTPTEQQEDAGPFNVRTAFDFIGAASIAKDGFHHDHITYSNVEIGMDAIVYYDEAYKEGINLTLDYNRTRFKWHDNPYFDQSKFQAVTCGVAFFTSRACNWDWKAYLGINLDTNHVNWDYTTYDMLLWGKYAICGDYVHLHGGVVVETGMKADRILPLLGFDWIINDRWTINAVFPVDMAVVYTIDCNWTADLAVRIFSSRYRVNKHEPLPKGIWEYRNAGLEGGINYNLGLFHVNFHAGFTLGGRVKVSNKRHAHPHHFNLDSAPYVGGEVTYRF